MLESEGKIVTILPEQTGTGKNGAWVKRDFVIETIEQYPKKICFSAWGDKTDILKTLDSGSKVKVTFFAESREFNSKWYTDLKVWKIENDGQKSGKAESFSTDIESTFLPEAGEDPTNDLPF